MILIRHGQSHFNAVFNVTRVDPGIVDADLTAQGIRQAEAAAEALRGHDIRVLLASPYSRTMHTAAIIADRLGLSVQVEPLVRERAFFACDIGSPRSQLAARWPDADFGTLPERWWPDPEESEAELMHRCALFAAAIVERRDWHHTGVVSHWAFIRGLTGHPLPNGTAVRFRPGDRGDAVAEAAAVVWPGNPC